MFAIYHSCNLVFLSSLFVLHLNITCMVWVLTSSKEIPIKLSPISFLPNFKTVVVVNLNLHFDERILREASLIELNLNFSPSPRKEVFYFYVTCFIAFFVLNKTVSRNFRQLPRACWDEWVWNRRGEGEREGGWVEGSLHKNNTWYELQPPG